MVTGQKSQIKNRKLFMEVHHHRKAEGKKQGKRGNRIYVQITCF